MNLKEKAEIFISKNKHRIDNQYRLNFHLMGEHGWINDPNGLIQYKGRYHAFFQYNPYDAKWAATYWGHAVSEDLIRWEYLPIALAPDSPYDSDGCFTGSAIEKDDRLYLIYTGNRITGPDKQKDRMQTQCLAYSDDGVYFEKYPLNPVIGTDQIPPHSSLIDFRDPRVIPVGDKFYMLIGANNGHKVGQILLYTSNDLIHWDFVNILARGNEKTGINWECPDLFQLGDKDILMVSAESIAQENGIQNPHVPLYMTGQFDIESGTFRYEGYHLLDNGFDFYAPQTFVDDKKRRIVIGWMHTWNVITPTQSKHHHWAGAMAIPREIKIKDERLIFQPVDEIKNYRTNRFSLENIQIEGEMQLDTFGDCFELQVMFDAQNAETFGLKLRTGLEEETVLSYDTVNGVFIFDRSKSGEFSEGKRTVRVELLNQKLLLHVFVDKCSVEVFINQGEQVMTGLVFPKEDSQGIKVFSKGKCTIDSLNKWDLDIPKRQKQDP